MRCAIPTLEKHYLRALIRAETMQLGPQIRALVNSRHDDMAIVVDFCALSAGTMSLHPKREVLSQLNNEAREEVGRKDGEILCCARVPLDLKTSALMVMFLK